MVAEFRQETPNMSYVSIDIASSGTSNDFNNPSGVTTSASDSDEQGRAAAPVRGHIIRGGDNPLLAGVMSAVPELRPVIMGGPAVDQSQVERMHQQRQHYPDNDASSTSTFLRNHSATNAISSRSGSNGSGPSNSRESNVNFRSEVNTPRFNGDRNTSILPNGNPRIRVANLPRSASTLCDRMPSHNLNGFPRSHSATSQNGTLIPNDVERGSQTAFQNQAPTLTVFSSSTLRYTGSPEMFPQLAAQAIGGAGGYSTHIRTPHHHHARGGEDNLSRRNQRLSRNVNYPDGSGAGISPYASGMRSSHQIDVSAPDYSTDINAAVVQDLIKSQQSLARENQELKRKLTIIVNTISDEQKLSRVLRCLEERRRGAAS